MGIRNFDFVAAPKFYLLLGILTYTASMGRKKNNPVEKESTVSAECKDLNGSNRLGSVEAKLDKLLDVVASMEGHIQKQEERSQIRELSPVPPAHSSVRVDPKLPSFEELKSDDKIQMELLKRLHQYDYTTRNEAEGKVSDAFKSSGEFMKLKK